MADPIVPLGMLGGLMAAHMVAVIERDGQRDEVAVEEPLEIRVDGVPLAVTMRTPGPRRGARARLPARRGPDRRPARRPGPTEDLAANIVEVGGPARRAIPATRRFYTTSSCGVCGRGALEEVAVHAPPAAGGPRRSRARCSPRCPIACASRRSRAPAACTRRACSTPARRAAARARGRRAPQRDGQGRRPRAARRAACRCSDRRAVRERAAVLRARPEGGGRRRARSSSASAPRRRWRSSSPTTAA